LHSGTVEAGSGTNAKLEVGVDVAVMDGPGGEALAAFGLLDTFLSMI
jgi:hypothetical protein